MIFLSGVPHRHLLQLNILSGTTWLNKLDLHSFTFFTHQKLQSSRHTPALPPKKKTTPDKKKPPPMFSSCVRRPSSFLEEDFFLAIRTADQLRESQQTSKLRDMIDQPTLPRCRPEPLPPPSLQNKQKKQNDVVLVLYCKVNVLSNFTMSNE